jgi:tRNA A-37 threonylcarbamoyl transferase component Bud32
MPDNASKPVDSLRTLRRGSLLRRAWCDADLPDNLVEVMLRGDPDRLLFSSNPLQVKDRCVVVRHESSRGSLLVKRHSWGSTWRTLRMAFREPAAERCAWLGEYLHARGIPTPRPRAYVDCRLGPWTYRSYLVSDYVEGESLYRHIRFGSQSTEELRDAARQVARIWESLVELGISHNDLKPENFIVDRNFNVWLIDLEKVRIRGKARRQRQRQVYDVQNFLHVRGWHRRLEARAIFAEAFLQTAYREWLEAAGVDRIAQLSSSSDAATDPELTVLVLCQNGVEILQARQAIESVRDIADEVVLVETRDADHLDVLKRIDFFAIPAGPSLQWTRPAVKPADLPVARFPWVLVLQQNECVTPFLAKELQQRIADERATDLVRIPIEKQVFGQSIARRQSEIAPVRLFRQATNPFQRVDDLLSIAADASRTSQLTGLIQRCECATVAEFVDRLNDQTTGAAKSRLEQGVRPRFGRASWRAAAQFIRSYFRSDGILSGWTGLQVAALQAGFSWIEETKLRQMAAEFAASDEDVASGEGALPMRPAQSSLRTSVSRQSKAA